MAGTIMPAPVFTGFDNSGAIVPGGLLYTYAAGTTTPETTYNNSDLDPAHANANPIELDAAGRAVVYLSPTTYKFVLHDADDALIWSQDNIAAVPAAAANVDIEGLAGEAISAGQCVYLSDGSGSLTAGRWYLADADQTYSSSIAASIGFAVEDIASGATGTIRILGQVTGLSGLTAGLVYYVSATAGSITNSSPTNSRQVGIADSSTTLVLTTIPGVASGSVAGIVSLSAQTLGAGVKTLPAGSLVIPGSLSAGTFDATLGGVVSRNVTSVGSSTGGETSLTGDVTVPANTLSSNGKALRWTLFLHTAANANNKSLNVYFGGTAMFASGTFTGAGARLNIKIVTTVVRVTASTQFINTVMVYGAVPTGGQTILQDEASGTKDLTAANILKLTAGTAVANNDIVFDASFLEVVG